MLWSPAICDAVTLQLNWSSIFSRTGMPPGVHRYRIDNRSSASALCSPLAKYSEIASCPALRTLMPKRFFFCSKGSISVLKAGQEAISEYFAKGEQSAEAEERLSIRYRWTPGGIPVLENMLLQLSCKVTASHIAGDHSIFVGEVEEAEMHEGEPLLYFRGEYRRIARHS